ncbi:hypothetical protein DPMN_162247 [Dreissena polymorpha]|uniref:Uncharacterized protein n=1 Tax=Dreissena polymorpha TaxID=45954 RepID=A0A9D4IU54_DREPO|nr:hypothetical protein DPMN_162247 [Dreissena polymorpha]
MLAEYLSGGLRVIHGSSKSMSTGSLIVSPEIPLTHEQFLWQGGDLGRLQGIPSIYAPPSRSPL